MEQLDQDVVNIAKAIRQTESQDNPNARGKSGEIGLYQYTPDTWNGVAKKYGVTSSLDKATRAEQNKVTYSRIKEWKDAGKNIGQVASMWNAGQGEPDAYTGKFSNGQPSKGVNSKGVQFDVPGYAKKVADTYHQIKGAGQGVGNISGMAQYKTPEGLFPAQGQSGPVSEAAPASAQDRSGVLGTNPSDSLYGKLIDNSVTRGIRKFGNFVTGGGTETLGESIGTLGGYAASKNKEQYDTSAPSIGETVVGAGKTLLAATAIKQAPKLIGAAKEALFPSIMKNATLKKLIPMSTTQFEALSAADKLDLLAQTANGASQSNKLVLQAAMNNLKPLVEREMGLAPGALASFGISAVGKLADVVKGILKLGVVGAGIGSAQQAVETLTGPSSK
jgi:hypothetical protein